MDNIMHRILVLAVSLMLTGCLAAPQFYNGGYYMVGDSSCRNARPISSTRIMCLDKKGRETGYRDAMTNQELYMYNQEMQMTAPQPQTTTDCYTTVTGMRCTTN